MLKNIIAPVQAWLISQKRCAGCGMPLAQGIKGKKGRLSTLTCRCKRVYVFDDTKKTYRRALLNET